MTDEAADRRREAERQDVQRIMRSAEALGHDPARVARALSLRPAEVAAGQHVVEVKRRRLSRLAGALARRS